MVSAQAWATVWSSTVMGKAPRIAMNRAVSADARSGCQTWFLVSDSIRAMICWSSSGIWGRARTSYHVIDGALNLDAKSSRHSPVELNEARDSTINQKNRRRSPVGARPSASRGGPVRHEGPSHPVLAHQLASARKKPKQTRPQPPAETGWADKAESHPPLRGPGGWGGDWYAWHAPDGLRARAATGLGCMQAGTEKLGVIEASYASAIIGVLSPVSSH